MKELKIMKKTDTINYENLELLGNLYNKTEDDWVLTMSLIVTEPVCPTVILTAEVRKDTKKFAYTGDSIEDAINNTVSAAIKHYDL